jgi:hypothetical protein
MQAVRAVVDNKFRLRFMIASCGEWFGVRRRTNASATGVGARRREDGAHAAAGFRRQHGAGRQRP